MARAASQLSLFDEAPTAPAPQNALKLDTPGKKPTRKKAASTRRPHDDAIEAALSVPSYLRPRQALGPAATAYIRTASPRESDLAAGRAKLRGVPCPMCGRSVWRPSPQRTGWVCALCFPHDGTKRLLPDLLTQPVGTG